MNKRRTTLITLLLLALFVVLPYLWPDDALDADAQRLLDHPRPAGSDPRSLAYGLFGFDAPSGQDIWALGRFRAGAYDTLGEIPDDHLPHLKFTVQSNDLCKLQDKDCWQSMLTALPALPGLLNANAELLARYAALHEANAFAEVLPATYFAPLPSYSNLIIGQRLTLRRSLRDFESGDVAGAWRTLDQELVFHRRLLADGGSLISKMIALNMVEQDTRMFAALAGRSAGRNASAAFPAQPPAQAPARLSLPELSMVRALDWEATMAVTALVRPTDRATFAALLGSDDAALGFRVLPFKRNTTINRALQPILALARESLLPAQEFVALHANDVEPTPSVADWYLNGAGMVLLVQTPALTPYLMRTHDLDALMVLNQVAHRLLVQRVTAAQVDGVLAALPAELHNPFDGKAPRWKDGVLSFDSGARETRVPLSLPVTLAP